MDRDLVDDPRVDAFKVMVYAATVNTESDQYCTSTHMGVHSVEFQFGESSMVGQNAFIRHLGEED